jgi:hypothetical protein
MSTGEAVSGEKVPACLKEEIEAKLEMEEARKGTHR